MPKPIRILHIITLSEWGGAQQVCYDLATGLDSSKYQVEVACAPGGELVSRLRSRSIPVHEIPALTRGMSPTEDIRCLVSLFRVIRAGHYDIVHCHSTKAGFLGRIAAKLAGVHRVYFTVHGWGFYNKEEAGRLNRALIWMERFAARLSSKLVCVSENDREQAIRQHIAPPSKLQVIPNGIGWEEPSDPMSQRRKLREEWGVTESDVAFGMVGRLAYQKNPQLFLMAASQIAQKSKSCRFFLIGEGPLWQECQQLVQEKQLESTVRLLGFQQSARGVLVGFDVFVLPSRFEGLPLTVIEAMFAGLPVIASDIGGTRELVSQGVTGLLEPEGEVQALVEAMEKLSDNPGLRRNFGENGRRVARERFTLERMIRDYDQLYWSIHSAVESPL